MLETLNHFAPAIQAGAAIISVIVAGLLAIITCRYVILTSRLAHAASEQLRFQVEVKRAKRNELKGLIKLFQYIIATLPTEQRTADRFMRESISWDETDLSRLQTLTAELGEGYGQRVAEAIGALRWMREKVIQVKSVDPRHGFEWEKFSWTQWINEIQRASQSIKMIDQALNELIANDTQ